MFSLSLISVGMWDHSIELQEWSSDDIHMKLMFININETIAHRSIKHNWIQITANSQGANFVSIDFLHRFPGSWARVRGRVRGKGRIGTGLEIRVITWPTIIKKIMAVTTNPTKCFLQPTCPTMHHSTPFCPKGSSTERVSWELPWI